MIRVEQGIEQVSLHQWTVRQIQEGCPFPRRPSGLMRAKRGNNLNPYNALKQCDLKQCDPMRTYTMVETKHATKNTAHPHYRIVLQTEHWTPIYKADRLSQVIAMLNNAAQGEAFDDRWVGLNA